MVIDVEYWWKAFTALASALGVIAAFIYAGKTIWDSTEKAKQRVFEKNRRIEALNKLADNIDKIESGFSYHERFFAVESDIADIRRVNSDMSALLAATIKHNQRQDSEIAKSLEERNILMDSLLGLLDKAIVDGANGTAHAARDAIRKYQTKHTHIFKDDI